ncbi:hypothetical protein ACTJIJ_19895 [Niabella sp. 22666]|uniref:hypothetical protein n=1 Tax=Niabella sp. 22666 TaxID=3453954 RepID=UPI003F8378CE
MALLFNVSINMPKKKINAFEFKYEGQFNSLDALTVLHSQINFVTILKEIKDHKFPEINLSIDIKGVEKGSLDINHLIEVAAVTGMFVQDNYKYIKTIFTIFGDIIKLKKFLKSKKADEVKLVGDKVEIHLHGDNMVIHEDAFKIYQKSPVITNALANTSKTLAQEEQIDYVQVSEKGKKSNLLKIDKEDFELLGEENPYMSSTTDEQVLKDQILFIKKPNLFPDKNKRLVWEMIHRGRDIKAVILDADFKKQINEGLRIAQGDRLRAVLKVYYKLDERFNAYIESGKYDVIKVEEVIERTSETKFDFI